MSCPVAISFHRVNGPWTKSQMKPYRTKQLLRFAISRQPMTIFNEKEQIFLALAFEQWHVEVASSLDEFEWDDQQREIVEAPETARLEVFAGPGMGKTAVACARVSKLIEGWCRTDQHLVA